MSEHPAELLRPPGDERPQRELFISCLEQRTLPPPQIPPTAPLPSTLPHVSKCDNSLICQGGSGGLVQGGVGLCVLAERAG